MKILKLNNYRNEQQETERMREKGLKKKRRKRDEVML